MKDIKQVSIKLSCLESKFASSLALGLLILSSFLLSPDFSQAGPPLRIQGEVTKHSTLAEAPQPTAAVFVIARRKDSRMPLAVQRLPNPKFPLKFDLGPEHIMVPGQKLEGEVFVEAKLTQRGDAISKSGDWVMEESPKQIQLQSGMKKLDLKLAKRKE